MDSMCVYGFAYARICTYYMHRDEYKPSQNLLQHFRGEIMTGSQFLFTPWISTFPIFILEWILTIYVRTIFELHFS